MTSEEKSTTNQRLPTEKISRLKFISEVAIENEKTIRKSSKQQDSTAALSPRHSVEPTLALTTASVERAESISAYNTTVHDAAKRFMRRQESSLSTRFSLVNSAGLLRPKKSLYDHIQSRIDTGLVRADTQQGNKTMDTYILGPTHPLKWRFLKYRLERDASLHEKVAQIKFNSGPTYIKQLKTISEHVRTKVKYLIASTVSPGEERYKIVVNVTAVDKSAIGLCIASRCLWNTATDGSITIDMKAANCTILIVVFICYTDLGAIGYD